MKRELYNRLVFLIGRHRSWVEVGNADAMRTRTIVRGGTLCDIICETLVLRAFVAHPSYERGMEWRIPHVEICRAIKSLRHIDSTFSDRTSKIQRI